MTNKAESSKDTQIELSGRHFAFIGCGVMAEYAVVHADNLVKIDPKIPLDRAALVGCAVTTGVGAVFNTARVAPGTSVAVWGAGGVGLNVIQGVYKGSFDPERSQLVYECYELR